VPCHLEQVRNVSWLGRAQIPLCRLCDFHRNFPAWKVADKSWKSAMQITSPTFMICFVDFCDLTLSPTFSMHCNGLNSITVTQMGLSPTCHGLCRQHLDTSRWFVAATFTVSSGFHDLSSFESTTFIFCVRNFPRAEVSVKVGVVEFGLWCSKVVTN